jgi:hypothetical protein
MMKHHEPFEKPDRRSIAFTTAKFLLGVLLAGGILYFALSNRRCYELLHGVTRKECYPANMGAATLEGIVEQTLQGVFATSCQRPFGSCGLFVDATVTRSGEKCVIESSPKVAAEWFNIDEAVYCQEKQPAP